MSLILIAVLGIGLLGCLAIAGILLVGGQAVPEWLVAILSAGFGGGLIHLGSTGLAGKSGS